MFSTASTVLSDVDLTSNYQLDIWATNYENAKARAAEGYGIVNCRDAYLYGNRAEQTVMYQMQNICSMTGIQRFLEQIMYF